MRTGSSFSLYSRLAISSASEHKDGAWAFLRELLLPRGDGAVSTPYFPTNRADFQRVAEAAMTPERVDSSGKEVSTRGESFGVVDGVELGYKRYAVTQAEYDQIMALYNAIDLAYRENRDLNGIVISAAGAYFAGDKSLDEAAELIQRRGEIYVNEQR